MTMVTNNWFALPDLMTELAVSDEARKRGVTVQVMQRAGGSIVRGLPTSSLQALPRGATVLNARRRSQNVIGPHDDPESPLNAETAVNLS